MVCEDIGTRVGVLDGSTHFLVTQGRLYTKQKGNDYIYVRKFVSVI